MSKIITPERPLVIPPLLAEAIGVPEAMILQQIHYWCRKSKHLIDGVKWFWKTYKDWDKEIPYRIGTIRRAIASLKARGLIIVEKRSAKTCYHANWYTINQERLKALWLSICPKRSNRCDRNDQIDLPNLIASSIYTENTPQEKISTDTPPNPPQSCDVKICEEEKESNQRKAPHQGMGNCAEVLRQIQERIEVKVKAEADPGDQISPAAPPQAENLPSIPLEEELKRQGINTSDRRLLKAISQSSDPYLAIKAWLEWATTHSVRNALSSLIVAINKGWRCSEPPPESRTEDNFSAATGNNSSQKSFLSTIPPCPEGLEEWAKYHRDQVKAITYSTFYNCWAIAYRNGALLPWLAAVEKGKSMFKAVCKDSVWYVEVEL